MSKSTIELWVWGPHVIREALDSAHSRVHEILLARSNHSLEEAAKVKGVVCKPVQDRSLTDKLGTDKHQNVGARVSLEVWNSFRDWFDSREKSESLFALALDGLEDPQNVGGLLRSAHFFGCEAVLMTKDRSAPITGTVAKASAGALFSIPIIRAQNLARELEGAEDLGILRIGLDAKGTSRFDELPLKTHHVLVVVGGEGEGLRELTQKRCNHLARLSVLGHRDSVNAAVAGAITCYEIAKQRA